MSLQFARARPLQACKLAAILAVLLFAIAGISGVVPYWGLTSFFLVVVLAVALAVVVALEAVVAAYRSLRAGRSVTDRFADRPLYATARAVESLAVLLAAGAFAYFFTWLPDDLPEGPGAIGALFLVTGIGLAVLAGSLVRTVAEYYDYWRNRAP